MATVRTPARLTGTLRPLLLFAVTVVAPAQELRPGVWGGPDLSAFPLPVSGYDVYLIGETHGVKETVAILRQYLARLYERAGLRDVALEEKPAYQREAQAYIEGKLNDLPEPLCLRAGILDALRSFNQGRKGSDLIQVRLVDIDLNPEPIRKHLLALKEAIPGSTAIGVPGVGTIIARGLETVAALARLTADRAILGELRTVDHSIRAYQQGLEVRSVSFKGSPYLDDREDAIMSNIADILHNEHRQAVLALYGNDHVSKVPLHNGGPRQDRDFPPLALRLERSGIKVFSVVTLPLTGRWYWRGQGGDLLWTASDGGFSNGDTFDRVLASAPGATFLYIDPRQERAKLPTQDLTRSGADAFLLFAHGTPAENRCATR